MQSIAIRTMENRKILRMVHADNAAEYISGYNNNIILETGGDFSTKIPYKPEENGIEERLNRTILNFVRSILYTEKMYSSYWKFVVCDVFFKQSLLMNCSKAKCMYV